MFPMEIDETPTPRRPKRHHGRQPPHGFAEDLEILERQQRNLQEHPDRKLLMLNIDAGGVHARRVIDRILAAEREPDCVPLQA